jgi:hypothetical protein
LINHVFETQHRRYETAVLGANRGLPGSRSVVRA